MDWVKDEIIGTWKIISWTYQDEDGKTVNYFGNEPSGMLTFTASGHINVQMMIEDRKNFKSEILSEAAPDEIVHAFQTYFGYYGTYEEIEPGVIVNTVEGCLMPNWLGNEEIRYARLEKGYLYLSAPPVKVGEKEVIFTVKWKRP